MDSFGPAGEENHHHKDGMVHFKDSTSAATMDSPQEHHKDKVATPVIPTGTDTIMEDTTTEVIEIIISRETILTTSMDTEITISAILMDTETTTSMDTGIIISIIFHGYRNSSFRGYRDNIFNNFNEHNTQGGFNSNQSDGNFINKELHMENQHPQTTKYRTMKDK